MYDSFTQQNYNRPGRLRIFLLWKRHVLLLMFSNLQFNDAMSLFWDMRTQEKLKI